MKIDIVPDGKNIRVLIIDDDEPYSEKISLAFKNNFPLIETDIFKNFFLDDIEERVIRGDYDFITLDADLDKWKPHEKFGKWGFSLIPFIKKNSPKTIIIVMSSSVLYNSDGLRVGAHLAIKKGDMIEVSYGRKILNPDLSIEDI